MKMSVKISIKIQGIIGTFLASLIFLSEEIQYFLGRISPSLMMPEMSPLSVFFWEKIFFTFLTERSYHICRKNECHLS